MVVLSSSSPSKGTVGFESVPKRNLVGIHPIMDREFMIYFNNDNLLVVKETPIDTRRISLPYLPTLLNSTDDIGNERVVDL